MKYWLFFLIISVGIEALAGLNCSRLNNLWRHKYSKDFKIQWKVKPFPCERGTIDYEVAKAIDALRTTVFKPDPSEEDLPDFYTLVSHAITQTTFAPPTPGIEWALAEANSDGALIIHQAFLNSDESWQVSLLVHESRHMSTQDPGHALCNHGTHAGLLFCDSQLFPRPFVGSGYNFQYYYLTLLARESTKTRLDKRAAKALLQEMILNNFNE